MKPADRYHSTLIMIVGMHRSGTSLLGSILGALDIAIPGTLIQGDIYNPEGYFERSDIVHLQEELLISLGRWWPAAAGTSPLPDDWINHPASRSVQTKILNLLGYEANQMNGVWALKDPRSSLLLPLWRRIASGLNIRLKLVLCVRDPAEVTASLIDRDANKTGMTCYRAQQLWWRHNCSVLEDSRDLPLFIADYSAWFKDGCCQYQLQMLARFCLEESADSEALTEAFKRIRPQHRRSKKNINILKEKIHPLVLKLHTRLLEIARVGSPESRLDNLRWWVKNKSIKNLPHLHPGAWFDRDYYRQQCSYLPYWINPVLHYRLLGWRRGLSPHQLFDHNYYRHHAHLRGVIVRGAPLLHYINIGLQLGLPCSSFSNPAWACQSSINSSLLEDARLEGLHPWGMAALAVNNGNLSDAIPLLKRWLTNGLNQNDLRSIDEASLGHFSFDGLQSLDYQEILPLSARVTIYGSDFLDWQVYAWIQHIPLPQNFEINNAASDQIHLFLGPIPEGTKSIDLVQAAGKQFVYASDQNSIQLLRKLGIQAKALKLQNPETSWLNLTNYNPEAFAELGLPDPKVLSEEIRVLSLGSSGPVWDQNFKDPIGCIPGFDSLVISKSAHAKILASWLNTCSRLGIQLVRLNPPHHEIAVDGWSALMPPRPVPPGWLPTQRFIAPIHPDELLDELAWRAAGCPPEPAVVTPKVEHQLLFQHTDEEKVNAAVCISLHNYADRIIPALESVNAQNLKKLEIIVVDDASSDNGPYNVQQWLEQNGNRFSRALLIQHTSNAGLAAARNTAFGLAKSEWCFVLDADNTLEPSAVADCLALATAAPPNIAVVHPLVERVSEGNAPQNEFALISRLSWQRHHFLERNVVDAMALVRRSAWQAVGGYDHIRGGWEDYDFWCKLIEAGFQGVLCPKRLARYHCHAGSMLTLETHLQLRRISRLLQQRHPWLKLALASEHTAQQC